MNIRKKASEIVEEVHFDFLNEYLFDLDLIDKFKQHFTEKLNGKNTEDRNHVWVMHRNFFFVLGKKNNLTHTYIGSLFGRDHATVTHNLIELSNLFEYKQASVLMARKNFADFLKSYTRNVSESILISKN